MIKNNDKATGLKKAFFLQSMFRSELFVNTSVLITGSVIAQVIPVLLQPFLRRSVSAEFFGAYSVYLSLIGILIVISSFKYELAIILPRKDKEAANVFMLSLILNALTNIVLLFIIIIFQDSIAGFLNLSEQFSHYLLFVPLGTFLFGTYQVLNYWLLRKKSYFQASVNKFVRRSAEGLSQVGLKASTVPGFLLYGDIIGHFVNVFYGIIQAFRSGMRMEFLSSVKLKYVSAKYSYFPIYNLIPSLMSSCSALLPAIMINKFYSTENAGYIDLTRMLLSIPVALISISVSNVLLERVSEKYKKNISILKDLSRISIFLLFICIIEIILITFAGEKLFVVFFGHDWLFSGILAKTLVWSYTLNFLVSSFYSLFLSLNRIKILSVWQLLYFVAILSLLFFRKLPFDEFLRIYVCFEIIIFSVLLIFMAAIVLDYEKKLKLTIKV